MPTAQPPSCPPKSGSKSARFRTTLFGVPLSCSVDWIAAGGARRHSRTSGFDQQPRIIIERPAARRPILQCMSRPFDCAESSRAGISSLFLVSDDPSAKVGLHGNAGRMLAPIRARPRTSCAFPSPRRISALNSARRRAGCTTSPMRARPRQPSVPTRLLFRVIAADIRLLAMSPADKEDYRQPIAGSTSLLWSDYSILECLLHEAQNLPSRRTRRAFKRLRPSKPLGPVRRASWEERAMRAALSARLRRPCAAPPPFITSFLLASTRRPRGGRRSRSAATFISPGFASRAGQCRP